MFSKTNLRFILAVTLIIFALSFIFGCAAKKQFWGDEKSGFIFNYNHPKDQVWTYHATTNQVSTQEVMGQSYVTTTDITADYSINGAGIDGEKNIISNVKMDSIKMAIKSMQGESKPDLGAIVGKSFGLTFSSSRLVLRTLTPQFMSYPTPPGEITPCS